MIVGPSNQSSVLLHKQFCHTDICTIFCNFLTTYSSPTRRTGEFSQRQTSPTVRRHEREQPNSSSPPGRGVNPALAAGAGAAGGALLGSAVGSVCFPIDCVRFCSSLYADSTGFDEFNKKLRGV